MSGFDETRQGWAKRNQLIGVKLNDKSGPNAGPKYAEDAKWREFAREKRFTHFVALRINTLMPQGELQQKLGGLQDELVQELGGGVVSKAGTTDDLFVRLLGLEQSSSPPHAIEMALRGLKPLDIIERPQLEFGGVVPGGDRVDVTLFSQVLEDLVNHLNAHFNRSPGVKAEKLSLPGTLVQAGLFRLPVLNVNRPDEFKKPPKKGRLGKFDFQKLHIVDLADNAVFATIDLGERDV